MIAGIDRILLGRKPEGILAHRMKHGVALHPLHP